MKEKIAVQTFMELSKKVNEIMHLLTGHQLAQGIFEYNKDHINYLAKYRMDVINILESRQIVGLIEQLRILRYAMDSMESIISGEVDNTLEQ